MKKMLAVLVAAVVIASVLPADAATGITGRGGTLGIGIEVTQSIVPKVNARVGFNFFNYDYSATEDDIEYDFGLKLRSVNIFADFHPFPGFGSGFRISGGLLYNKNKADLVAVPQGTYDIGGQDYTAAEVGTLRGSLNLKDLPPYFGIGWGNASQGVVSLALDIGLAFSGSPNVDLSASGLVTSQPGFQQDLAQEEADLEDDINRFKYYPVVSLGISVHVPGL